MSARKKGGDPRPPTGRQAPSASPPHSRASSDGSVPSTPTANEPRTPTVPLTPGSVKDGRRSQTSEREPIASASKQPASGNRRTPSQSSVSSMGARAPSDKFLVTVEKQAKGANRGLSKENMILLSPSAMQSFGVLSGEPVLLTRTNNKQADVTAYSLARAWPLSKLTEQQCRVQIYTDTMSTVRAGDPILVERIGSAFEEVASVTLRHISRRPANTPLSSSSSSSSSVQPTPPPSSPAPSANQSSASTPVRSATGPKLNLNEELKSAAAPHSAVAQPAAVVIDREFTAIERACIVTAVVGRPFFLGMVIALPLDSDSVLFQITHVQTRNPSTNTASPNRAESTGYTGPTIYIASPDTVVTISSKKPNPPAPAASAAANTAPGSTLDKDLSDFNAIGGLDKEIFAVRELLEMSLTKPETFSKFGIRPPKGVLLFGPPGTGKTMIARAIAKQAFAEMFVINGAEIVSKYVGESEEKLRSIFETARQKAPSIVFLDEIDALCPKRDDAVEALQRRLVGSLLTLMDGMFANEKVVVIAATNRPNALDPALRRPGRFDREIEIGIPNESGRLDILTKLLSRIPNSLTPDETASIASITHGYVGADLTALLREAAFRVLHRIGVDSVAASYTAQPPQTPTKPLPTPLPSSSSLSSSTSTTTTTTTTTTVGDSKAALIVSLPDVQYALNVVRPSAMREVAVDVPKVKWSDIGGQLDVKQRLKEAVEWPLKHPDAFIRMGIRPPKGILLFGPPGCSKTLMAKALANESSQNFIAVKGPELFSKWVGDSEKAVRSVFHRAKAAAPSIVFFDEIDAIAGKRSGGDGGGGGEKVADRVLSQLLIEMDGVEELRQITILGATNRPDMIDPALLRPGRMDRILYVGPPDEASAKEIYDIELRKMAHAADVDSSELARRSPGLSGAEISAVCREAAMVAMEEDIEAKQVEMRHFASVLGSFKPRITADMLQFYKNYQLKSGLSVL